MDYKTVLDFWFGQLSDSQDTIKKQYHLWFGKDPEVDAKIIKNFLPMIEAADGGKLAAWEDACEGRLALIILFDQFTRNCFRDTPRMYAYDAKALELCLAGIKLKHDQQLPLYQRLFFYMPLEHSEEQEHQRLMIQFTQEMIKQALPEQKEDFENFHHYALLHKKVIDQFGRYPHRNKILGRKSTAEEITFLALPNSSF